MMLIVVSIGVEKYEVLKNHLFFNVKSTKHLIRNYAILI